MSSVPRVKCGVCPRFVTEPISGDRRVVKTSCNHFAHRSCFFENEALHKTTRVQTRVFCPDHGCEKSKDPKCLYRGKKDHWQEDIVTKRKIEVIEVTVERPVDRAPEVPRPVDALMQQRADLAPLTTTIKVALVAMVAICTVAVFQTYFSVGLGIGLGLAATSFVGKQIEDYILRRPVIQQIERAEQV